MQYISPPCLLTMAEVRRAGVKVGSPVSSLQRSGPLSTYPGCAALHGSLLTGCTAHRRAALPTPPDLKHPPVVTISPTSPQWPMITLTEPTIYELNTKPRHCHVRSHTQQSALVLRPHSASILPPYLNIWERALHCCLAWLHSLRLSCPPRPTQSNVVLRCMV